MAYVAGLVGFICGFFISMQILKVLLRQYTKAELLEDPKLRKFGMLSWVIAIACAVAAHVLYNYLTLQP